MACSKEEIERKRLAAIQKRQSKIAIDSNLSHHSTSLYRSSLAYSDNSQSQTGPIKSFADNKPRHFHPYAKIAKPSRDTNNIPVGKVVSGTVYMVSEDRFEVNPSEFCTPLINIFKTLPTKSYDPKSKLWSFSLDDYESLMAKVAPLAPHVVLGPLPPYVLKILRENVMDPNNVDLSPVEATLKHKLMPFQEDGVRFAIARGGRCMIADDMGLGKTFQALAVASYYRHNWPLLIVTTSSMRETWQSKIHELLPSIPLMNIVTLTSSKDAQLVADKQTEVVIVSYKITSMHTDLLKNKKFGFVIIDESHYLKSHKAQCTVALTGITRRCSRAILLSGTPALSRPAELFTQLALILPRFVSYTEYGKRYCDGKQTNFGWDMTGQSNLAELQIILQKRFLIRRTKEQVLTNLEAKTRETVLLDQTLLDFSTGENAALSQAAESYRRTKPSERHAALITYFSESARVKIPAICKYIRQLVRERSEKFLVFAHHRCVIDAICNELDEASVHYCCIVGSTPPNTRAELVEKFQHEAGCRACVLSITAAHSGLTLTAAALVLFAELHWNPGILTQAEARAHRIGQCAEVSVRYLLADGTADDLMWPMLQDKLNVLNNVGLSKDTFEDTTMKHQESKTNIVQYLTSPKNLKNKSDYIPGTNIRKDAENNSDSVSDGVSSNSGNFKGQPLICNNSSNSAKSSTIYSSKCGNNSLNSVNNISKNCNMSSNSVIDCTEIQNSLANDLTNEHFENDISGCFENSFFDADEDDALLATLDL